MTVSFSISEYISNSAGRDNFFLELHSLAWIFINQNLFSRPVEMQHGDAMLALRFNKAFVSWIRILVIQTQKQKIVCVSWKFCYRRYFLAEIFLFFFNQYVNIGVETDVVKQNYGIFFISEKKTVIYEKARLLASMMMISYYYL